MIKPFCLVLLTFVCSVWAQDASTEKAATIERVKNLRVSSLDRGLPDVTVDFFLKYEGEGVPIEWRMTDCAQAKGSSQAAESKPATCVEAHFDSKDNRSVSVVISVRTSKSSLDGIARVVRVRATDQNGMTRTIDHLGDLPMELHRPLPKGPRDLPLPDKAG